MPNITLSTKNKKIIHNFQETCFCCGRPIKILVEKLSKGRILVEYVCEGEVLQTPCAHHGEKDATCDNMMDCKLSGLGNHFIESHSQYLFGIIKQALDQPKTEVALPFYGNRVMKKTLDLIESANLLADYIKVEGKPVLFLKK